MNQRGSPARATFHEQVVDRLGRDICGGRYRPGEVLPSEPELCERFGFSRIVIREAIKSLVAKGMLEVSRRIGTLVLEPSRWNLFDPEVIEWRTDTDRPDPNLGRDLMELRRVVEPAAARLAATRARDADRRALRAAYMAMARAVAGKGNYVEADTAFHSIILGACGNQFLQQMQQAMAAMLHFAFAIVSRKTGGPAQSLPLHEALCVAIERGDPDAAERAALSLIDGAEADYWEQMDPSRDAVAPLHSQAA